MTEDDAIAWTRGRFGNEAVDALQQLVAAVADENMRQNLVAPSTILSLWSRHIVDSLQLVDLAGDIRGTWIDIGTGGGFPGLAVAIVRSDPMMLVEPRKKRAAFLDAMAATLGLSGQVAVQAAKAEGVTAVTAAIISARAVASIDAILRMAMHLSNEKTCWLLPRGRFDSIEMIGLRRHWSFMFHVEQSLTDADSSIVVMTGVRAK